MRALGAADILRLWETAHRFHPVDQALSLMAAAEPGRSRDELAALPLGRRDGCLLALRQATFGDHLSGRTACPQCNLDVEFELACSRLRAPAPAIQPRKLQVDGYVLWVRPPNSYDIAAAARSSDVSEARRVLVRCCLIEIRHDDAANDAAISADALPETVNAAVARAALAADPQAELLLDLACPACEHRWQAVLDIVHILWAEVAARAQRLLVEVHLLARAYGWREAEILALSPARRATYLQMVAV